MNFLFQECNEFTYGFAEEVRKQSFGALTPGYDFMARLRYLCVSYGVCSLASGEGSAEGTLETGVGLARPVGTGRSVTKGE